MKALGVAISEGKVKSTPEILWASNLPVIGRSMYIRFAALRRRIAWSGNAFMGGNNKPAYPTGCNATLDEILESIDKPAHPK